MDNLPQLSIDEAARKLGVSTKTLRRWEAEGKIKPSHTLGGHRRYPSTLLETFHPKIHSHHVLTSIQKQVLAWTLAVISFAGVGIVVAKNYSKFQTSNIQLPTSNESNGSVLASESINDDY